MSFISYTLAVEKCQQNKEIWQILLAGRIYVKWKLWQTGLYERAYSKMSGKLLLLNKCDTKEMFSIS